MSEYQIIKSKVQEILAPLGFTEGKAEADRGPTSCVFSKGDKKFMIQWDEGESMGSVEVWEDGDWNMLESIVPQAPEPKFSECLNALCDEIKSRL